MTSVTHNPAGKFFNTISANRGVNITEAIHEDPTNYKGESYVRKEEKGVNGMKKKKAKTLCREHLFAP